MTGSASPPFLLRLTWWSRRRCAFAQPAEILRIACMLATEAGIEVCMPVHDALLVNTPIATLDLNLVRIGSQQVLCANTTVLRKRRGWARDGRLIRKAVFTEPVFLP